MTHESERDASAASAELAGEKAPEQRAMFSPVLGYKVRQIVTKVQEFAISETQGHRVSASENINGADFN
jgi:hypothetical protein